jgi:hypothetical protein
MKALRLAISVLLLAAFTTVAQAAESDNEELTLRNSCYRVLDLDLDDVIFVDVLPPLPGHDMEDVERLAANTLRWSTNKLDQRITAKLMSAPNIPFFVKLDSAGWVGLGTVAIDMVTDIDQTFGSAVVGYRFAPRLAHGSGNENYEVIFTILDM